MCRVDVTVASRTFADLGGGGGRHNVCVDVRATRSQFSKLLCVSPPPQGIRQVPVYSCLFLAFCFAKSLLNSLKILFGCCLVFDSQHNNITYGVLASRVSALRFITVNPLWNGTWIYQKPVFRGNLLQPRWYKIPMIQISRTCIKRNVPATGKICLLHLTYWGVSLHF
jgi:hypothetical protein